MGKADILKEVERTIDGRRLGGAFAIKVGEQVISLRRLGTFQKQTQHLAPDFRQPLPPAGGERFGLNKESLHVLWAARCVGVDVIVCMCVGHGPNVGLFDK